MFRLLIVFGVLGYAAVKASRGPFYVLLLYLWIAYFRPEAWVWSSVISSLNLSYVSSLFLLVTTVLAGVRLRWHTGILIVFLFTLHGLMSALMSRHQDWAMLYWNQFARAALIAYLIVLLTTDTRKYRLVILIIAVSLGAEGAKQGWVQFILNPGSVNANSHPFLGDNNGVAMGMLMIVPLFAACARTSTHWAEKGILRFLLVGVILRAITTYSRGAFLSLGALAAVYWWRSRNKLRTLVGIVLVAALVLPIMPPAFWDRMDTINPSSGQRDESAAGRLYLWSLAVKMAEDHPWLGVGFSSFSQAYNGYDTTGGWHGRSRAVHSTWFGVLADLGYPGLLMLVGLVLIALFIPRQVRRLVKPHSHLSDLGLYADALESSLVVFVVAGTFLNSQYSEILWHFFGLAIALRLVTADAVRAEETPATRAAAA